VPFLAAVPEALAQVPDGLSCADHGLLASFVEARQFEPFVVDELATVTNMKVEARHVVLPSWAGARWLSGTDGRMSCR
jgi:hypothetical protein